MIAVGEIRLVGRHEAVALDLAERRAHARRHRSEPGLGARLRVHRVDLGNHAGALRCEVLRIGAAHAEPREHEASEPFCRVR